MRVILTLKESMILPKSVVIKEKKEQNVLQRMK